jgi:leader peptidase (prepilin peptidase)/N-methyltransferase
MREAKTGERTETQVAITRDDLRPNVAILLGGALAIAAVSAVSLAVPIAFASFVLGVLMVAGADVDARTYLLPDAVTYGAAVCGIAAAAALADRFDPLFGPWLAAGDAILRAAGASGLLALLRWSYGCIRQREGIGLGDVKLAAAVGAWLPLDAVPLCFGLAASGALVAALCAHLRGHDIDRAMKLPFGAFLCPALWLTFYAANLPGQS